MIKKLVYAVLLIISASSLVASEINIYSYRQPFLIKPLTDAFTKETGVKVNVAYLRKGMIERMKAEGKRSPADVVLTVDICSGLYLPKVKIKLLVTDELLANCHL